jgi:hypothetical protein
MADDAAISLDGFLDEETVPGDVHGATARFRVTVSPTDGRMDEMILPCSVADPALAHAVLHDLAPGDKLRVTGYLHLPGTPDAPIWLAVTALAVLETAPLVLAWDDSAPVHIERYGEFLCWFDADTPEAVEVFTETGVWVGTAPEPELLPFFASHQAKTRRERRKNGDL